jgi:hypothetical protein
MTFEEATEQLKTMKNTFAEQTGFNEEACDIAIAAIEKQIPLKPVLKNGKSLIHAHYADGHGEFAIQKWQDWVCPVCGWFVGQRYNRFRSGREPHPHDQRKSDWCNECGQKIDWSDHSDHKEN